MKTGQVVTNKKTISRWKLVANGSWLAGQEFPVYEEGTILGRGKTCDVTIPGTHLSRSHAQLLVQGNQLLVKDLASANGTFINDERINDAIIAKPGDILRIDVYTFRIAGPQSATDEQKPALRPSITETAAQSLETIRKIKQQDRERDYTQTEWITKPTSIGNRTHNVPSHPKGHDGSFWMSVAFALAATGVLVYIFLF